MFRWRVCVTPLKSRFPRAHIDLARRGAWSAAIRHAPRVLGGAVGTKERAQLIKETFCMGVILTSANSTERREDVCSKRHDIEARGAVKPARAIAHGETSPAGLSQ